MKRNIPGKDAELKSEGYVKDGEPCVPGKRETASPQDQFPLNICLRKKKKQLRSFLLKQH